MIEFKLMIEFCTHLLITTVGAFLFYFVAVLSRRSWFIEKLPNYFQGIAQAPLQRTITLIIALFLFFTNVFYLSPKYYISKNNEAHKKIEESALQIKNDKLSDRSLKFAISSRPDEQVQFEKLIKEQLDTEDDRKNVKSDDPDLFAKNIKYRNSLIETEKLICSIFRGDKSYKINNWTGYIVFNLEDLDNGRQVNSSRFLSYAIYLPTSLDDNNYRGEDDKIELRSGKFFYDAYHTLVKEEDNPIFFKDLLNIKKMSSSAYPDPGKDPVVVFSGRFFSAADKVKIPGEKPGFECLRRNSDIPSGGIFSEKPEGPGFHFKLTAVRLQ